MILFNGWVIRADGQIIARQFDNLTRKLEVCGNLPDGWDWTALVRVNEAMDLIPLEITSNGLSVDLTEEHLSLSGHYEVQLRAVNGDLVRHTNIITVYVPESLSGNAHWPEIPTEFTELEQRANAAADRASAAAQRAENAVVWAPIIRNGNWWSYDFNRMAYVDTGVRAKGEDNNVFIATYGVTTIEEMETAYNAGKVLFCKDGGNVSPLFGRTDVGSFVFYSNNQETLTKRSCTAKFGWNKTTHTLCGEKFEALDDALGDIDTALDGIIAIQNTLIGGSAE